MRTGLGGQKVVLDGGAFVLPIVHDVIPVNMNTLRLEVSRGRDKALITKDRMRVDVIAEFYVRVAASAEAVAAAAQTLGLRTMEPEQLKELVEGKFVDALRTAAAEMTMEELHEKRGAYVKRVREAVAERPDQERPRARSRVADAARPDRHGVLQPEQRLRRRGPDAPDRADRAPQEAAQRRRAGHADRDPQQEPRGREALAGDRPRKRIRAPDAAARGRDRARPPARRGGDRARAARAGRRGRADHRQADASTRRASAPSRRIEQERIGKERAIQGAEIERRQALELAEQQRAIAVARESKAQSEAQAAADDARARRPCRPRRRCSPRARSRWPSARRRSS